MDDAFTYIKKNKGIDTEESYPYEGKNGKCRFQAATIGATDTGFTDIAQVSYSMPKSNWSISRLILDL